MNNNGASISYVILDTSLSPPTIVTPPVITITPDTQVGGILSIVSDTVWSPAGTALEQRAQWQSANTNVDSAFTATTNFNDTYTTVLADIGKYWRLRQASTGYETFSYSNVIGPVIPLIQNYSLTANPISPGVEGGTVTITLTTVNVNNGSVPYTIGGTGITAADFGLTSLTGSFNLVNNTASITLNLTSDNIYETYEDFTLRLDNGLASITYRINDPPSTYAFNNPPSTVNEGDSVTFYINTTFVRDNTVLYWDIDYNTASTAAADFSASSGSFSISADKGSFSIGISNDFLNEGPETF